KSTFTIESETNFDSGVITLGGGQSRTIINMADGIEGGDEVTSHPSILITVSEPHNLRPGDQISIGDTIPNIDGIYIIQDTPSPTTLTIGKVFPGIPPGADVIGTIRSALTMDTGYDVGVQANWHTGQVENVDGARTAFFGLDRSTKR